MVSSLFHAIALILFALWAISTPNETTELPDLVVSGDGSDSVIAADMLLDNPQSMEDNTGEAPVDLVEQFVVAPPVDFQLDTMPAMQPDILIGAGADFSPENLSLSVQVGPGPAMGGGLQGRTAASRAAAIGNGATGESEAAVERGLAWLARHQLPDGSWHFHINDVEGCTCRNTGQHSTTTAATGLALLPFLGAGYTHTEGKYQEVVHKGIYYLVNHMVETPQGGDLREDEVGSMYEQAIATIAICEAYAMTNDRSLAPIAQQAIDFIVNAQHDRGGWRYMPGDQGDTTVTGWQVMALKSGFMARLRIPTPVWYKVGEYLDSVQVEDGAYYGYRTPGRDDTNTAVGLFVRMLLGWEHDHRPLAIGVKYLDTLGPSPNDLYYDYYATMVMHHYEGRMWNRWNPLMRDHLVATQATAGHESGSWFFAAPHTTSAGRLYNTAMAIMILEVYYRYMPLYSEEALFQP